MPERLATLLSPLWKLLSHKYYVDEIYQTLVVAPLAKLAQFLWRPFDQGLIDGAVNGTGFVVTALGEVLRTTQTGQVRHYAFLMFVSSIVLIFTYLVAF